MNALGLKVIKQNLVGVSVSDSATQTRLEAGLGGGCGWAS